MIAIRKRLWNVARSEGGLTLVEIVVAMFIFTLISVGVLYTMVSVLSVTRDSRSRQVASNLAAQEVDLARDVSDIFKVGTYSHTVVLNGDTYTVKRTQEWVYSSGDAAACGTGVGAMRYKFVHVKVTWGGMRGGNTADDAGVTSETFINPNERINDVTKGSLVVGVKTAGGNGVQNATVTAVPSTGTTLTGKTDLDGCVFFLGVVPNSNFTVTITAPTSTSYVDFAGVSSPQRTGVNVVAGSATSLPFTYDPSGTLRVTYVPTVAAQLPLNLSTSLLSTRDAVISTATAATNPRSWLVSPNPYAVIAGNASACWANDPANWTASGSLADGEQPEPVDTLPGTTVDATVTMSTLTVTGMGTTTSSNRFLVAVGHPASMMTGEPQCLGDPTLVTLRWPATSTSTMTVALPYGSWDIWKGTASGFVPPSGATRITTGMTAGVGGSISSGVVTLDPRGPA